jgi:maltose alpha-D-glucosyltransferase / alpha-amylase
MDDNPQWYKDAVIYELHVRAFRDSDGDGIGDFRGLIEKLDYLQDLGITAIWILPFYPSPLRDDGYDIADYLDVNPAYGTIADFQAFLREAHARDLRVITELVLNHTSDRHAWFQRARRSPAGSSHRNFYVWSDTSEKYQDARIIFKDFETSNWSWDPEVREYYWHRFYSHQPDLNFDNPEVRAELTRIVDFWLAMGVDGLRLDAVPYLYEREGTNCENLTETHGFLKELRRHIDEKFPNRMVLAEANQWPEDAISYFGDGDECHTAFHFPVMPRLFMSLHMEDRFPIIDILQQTPAIPEACQWVLFLRNHDELTLEMVTDEERDYMYRVYANDPQARINLGIRRRLAPLLGNNRRRIELLNLLLLSLPGTPVIYYGDEIGMGDNIYLGDRNGVRTPMQWSADRNAGFSSGNAQRMYLPTIIDPEYHYEAINVETQRNNPQSLFWWMKRSIALRQQHRAFGRGTIEFLYPDNRKVLAFVRRYEEETILIVANLSRFAQYVELDLSAYRGRRPRELYGRVKFPPIGNAPYLLTLGPHGFHGFVLEERPETAEIRAQGGQTRTLELSASGEWTQLLRGRVKRSLERILSESIVRRRWFGGKARTIQTLSLVEVVPLSPEHCLVLLHVDYVDGEPEEYLLPLSLAVGPAAEKILSDSGLSLIARVHRAGSDESSVLYDSMADEQAAGQLLDLVEGEREIAGQHGRIVGRKLSRFDELRGETQTPLKTAILRAEQSNSSVLYGDRLILKLFRRPEEGINPDVELTAYLTEKVGLAHVPPVAGTLEYHGERGPVRSLAVVQGFVPNEGDAWKYALDHLSRYFERVLTRAPGTPPEPALLALAHPLRLAEQPVPEVVRESIGGFIHDAQLLGQRTAELHVALAGETADPAFVPEPFTQLFQRSFYQSARNLTGQTFGLLKLRLAHLPEELQAPAQKLVDGERTVLDRFRALTQRRLSGLRIRVHGDYHLGQVLFTGKDFVIIDFEGEPARPLSERRIKRSPLRDVAGMLRSFHYAAFSALSHLRSSGISSEPIALGQWARVWHAWTGAVFLRSYLQTPGVAAFLPQQPDELEILLDTLILEKAIYELKYELNNRPDWVPIPMDAIMDLIGPQPSATA